MVKGTGFRNFTSKILMAVFAVSSILGGTTARDSQVARAATVSNGSSYSTPTELSNSELQDVLYDQVYKKYQLVDWEVLSNNLNVELVNQGYPDGKGLQAIHYKPYLSSATGFTGYMLAHESTSIGQYGEVTYGPSKKIYVGNKPFVIAFREKRYSNSASLENVWRAVVYSYNKNADGTFSLSNNGAYYATSDRDKSTYSRRFNFLDGSTNPNVKGTYDQWITNFITVTPNPNYPINYVTLQLERYLSQTQTWEGLIDDIWVGPADQFNPTTIGNISGTAGIGEISKLDPEETSNESFAEDPVNTASGAHEIQKTLLKVQGEQPLSFDVRYNSLLLNQGPLGKGWEHNFESKIEALTNGNVVIHWSANRNNTFLNDGSNNFASQDLATRLDTLVKNSDGSYTLTRKDQTVYQFNSSGQLTNLLKSHGQALTFTYNTSGQLVTITEPISGQALSLHYNSTGSIDTLTDNANRQVTFAYDSSNNLTGITNSNGQNTGYTYDSNGRVLTGTDPEGVVLFTNTFDNQGRVITQTDAASPSHVTKFSYDENSQPGKIVTTVTDRNGQTKILTHDSSYELLSIQDELSNITSYTYDSNGNRASVTDAKGNVTNYSYDNRGNLLGVTDAQGNTTQCHMTVRTIC